MPKSLPLFLITYLKQNQAYGYQLTKEFPEYPRSTLYHFLQQLERHGYVTHTHKVSKYGPVRKYFRSTQKGRKYLSSTY